jgi:hypothetical protein
MKTLFNLFAMSVTLALAQLTGHAQFLILDLGNIVLQPEQGNQQVDLIIQNTDSNPLDNIFGLNFALQIADGASGPQVNGVSLYFGNSIFSSYSANQIDQGSTTRSVFYGIDAGGTPVSLPAQSSTLLARLTFDTTGVSGPSGPYAIAASDVGPIHSSTSYVLIGGSTRPIDTLLNGTITIVPEPTSSTLMASLASLVVAGFIRWKKGMMRFMDFAGTVHRFQEKS